MSQSRVPTLFACLASVFASSALHAQPRDGGVTVYGIVDTFIGRVKGSTSSTVVSDGANAASRLGFRGREDLGGGLSAHFALELGYSSDTGTSLGSGFGRQSWVGLSGPWGEVTAGRQYSSVFHNLLAASTFGMNGNWAPVQLFGSTNGFSAAASALGFSVRHSNMLRYQYNHTASPGFGADIFYAPGEDNAASGRLSGFGVGHRGRDHFVGYSQQRQASGTGAAPGFHNETRALSGTYSPSSHIKLNLNLIETNSTSGGGTRMRHVVPGVVYQVGKHVFRAEFAHLDRADSANDADMLTLGYDHVLSKRTSLYARMLWLNNKSTAAHRMAQAVVRANSGDDVRGTAIGIRHAF